MRPSPNISRSSVVGCLAKYELTKNGVMKECFVLVCEIFFRPPNSAASLRQCVSCMCCNKNTLYFLCRFFPCFSRVLSKYAVFFALFCRDFLLSLLVI